MLSMKNATPHAINVYDKDGRDILATIKVSATPIRLIPKAVEIVREIGNINNHSIDAIPRAGWKGFDDPDGVVLHTGPIIVSMVVADYLKSTGERTDDVYVPDTGPESVVRNSEGQIIGVRRFIYY